MRKFLQNILFAVLFTGPQAAFGESPEPFPLKIWCTDGPSMGDKAAVTGTVTIMDEPFGSINGRATADLKVRRFSQPDDPSTYTEEVVHVEGTGLYGGMGTEWGMRLHLKVPGPFSGVCTDESRIARLDLEYSTQDPNARGRVELCNGETLFTDCSWTALANSSD